MPNRDVTADPSPGPDFTIRPQGAFSLQALVNFGFGQRDATSYEGVMRLAFCADGYDRQVGVAVRHDANGVHGWITGARQGPDAIAVVRTQVARVLSLDHDGRRFDDVGRRDPVIGELQRVAPGLRPPLFYSPYEAAVWCVLSARRPAPQMAALRRRLSETCGQQFLVAGEEMAALPTPRQLLDVQQFPDLPEVKLRRLHGVARAALEGRLDAAALCDLGEEAGSEQLRRLEGIGPFYASLIMIRSTGLADLLPLGEPKLLALVAELYGLAGPPGPEQLTALAESWRPLRTWAAVLIRAAAIRRHTSSGV